MHVPSRRNNGFKARAKVLDRPQGNPDLGPSFSLNSLVHAFGPIIMVQFAKFVPH